MKKVLSPIFYLHVICITLTSHAYGVWVGLNKTKTHCLDSPVVSMTLVVGEVFGCVGTEYVRVVDDPVDENFH